MTPEITFAVAHGAKRGADQAKEIEALRAGIDALQKQLDESKELVEAWQWCAARHVIVTVTPGARYPYAVRFVHSEYHATVRAGETLAEAVRELRAALLERTERGDPPQPSDTIADRVDSLERCVDAINDTITAIQGALHRLDESATDARREIAYLRGRVDVLSAR